jgi:hypothetical protein
LPVTTGHAPLGLSTDRSKKEATGPSSLLPLFLFRSWWVLKVGGAKTSYDKEETSPSRRVRATNREEWLRPVILATQEARLEG